MKYSQINNKINENSLFSGDYNDLTNKPQIYSYFCIWAEENAVLNDGYSEYSFGNGDDVQPNHGIVFPFTCELIGLTLDAENATTATVRVVKNGDINLSDYQVYASGERGVQNFTTPLSFGWGDAISFRTISVTGTTSSGRVCAWFRRAV